MGKNGCGDFARRRCFHRSVTRQCRFPGPALPPDQPGADLRVRVLAVARDPFPGRSTPPLRAATPHRAFGARLPGACAPRFGATRHWQHQEGQSDSYRVSLKLALQREFLAVADRGEPGELPPEIPPATVTSAWAWTPSSVTGGRSGRLQKFPFRSPTRPGYKPRPGRFRTQLFKELGSRVWPRSRCHAGGFYSVRCFASTLFLDGSSG
jgi:hypothetical protein